MLGKLVLLILQAGFAWVGGPLVRAHFAVPGEYDLLVYVAIFGGIAFLVGIIAKLAIKNIRTPTIGVLIFTLVGGVVGAVVATYGSQYVHGVEFNAITQRGVVLGGALIGYFFKS